MKKSDFDDMISLDTIAENLNDYLTKNLLKELLNVNEILWKKVNCSIVYAGYRVSVCLKITAESEPFVFCFILLEKDIHFVDFELNLNTINSIIQRFSFYADKNKEEK